MRPRRLIGVLEQGQSRHQSATLDRNIFVLGAGVALRTVMTVLDLTVVSVALPTIGRTFGVSISSIQWVATAYMLAFASVIPLTGWASERFGARGVWFASLLLLLFGSAPGASGCRPCCCSGSARRWPARRGRSPRWLPSASFKGSAPG